LFSQAAYARALDPLLGQAAGYARSLLRDRHDAEDAVQQAALRGLQRLESYDATRPFKGWWFAILRHCCIDIMRQTKARRSEPLDGNEPEQSSEEPSLQWWELDAAIAALSPAHQEILRLRYFGDLSYAELAETLGVPPGTIMSRLHLARKALSAQLHEDEP